MKMENGGTMVDAMAGLFAGALVGSKMDGDKIR